MVNLSKIFTFLAFLFACNSIPELPDSKKSVAQFMFILPDRAELTGEVDDIQEQMNAYRISIVPTKSQEVEDCDQIEELKKYRDSKEIHYDLKADCEYSVDISLGAYQIVPNYKEADSEESSEVMSPNSDTPFRLTGDEDEGGRHFTPPFLAPHFTPPIFTARPQRSRCSRGMSSCKLQATSYKLRATSYKLRATSYEL